METVITKLNSFDLNNNKFYIKRDDLLPFCFGGNKARKAELFFDEIKSKNADSIVTYGSSSSNHCRIVANLAAANAMDCYIVSPSEIDKQTFNKKMMKLFNATILTCSIDKVSSTIENLLSELRLIGRNPYFIPGGGHGNIGSQAYVDCFNEIVNQQKNLGLEFDYIFHASGTGTTQAGLVCGKLINNSKCKIVGISIARNNPRGRDVIVQSVKEYLIENNYFFNGFEDSIIFNDEYVCGGYGKANDKIAEIIKYVLINEGVTLDSTYTGKAFFGMLEYIKKQKISDKNILFIHTGGTPLFFDYFNE